MLKTFKAVPVTLEEWEKIIATLQPNEKDVFEIVLNDGEFRIIVNNGWAMLHNLIPLK